MEMDRQTILVLFAAIIGLTLFGGVYLSSEPVRRHERPTYAPEDIRYKFQKEAAKATKRKGPEPIISSEEDDDVDGDEPNEEPSSSETQEEPELN